MMKMLEYNISDRHECRAENGRRRYNSHYFTNVICMAIATKLATTGTITQSVVVHAYAIPPFHVSAQQNNFHWPTKFSGLGCKSFQSPSCTIACGLRCGGDNIIGTSKTINSLPSSKSTTLFMATQSANQNNDSGKENRRSMDKYHLIWSPYFWKKMLLSTLLWCIIQYTARKNLISLPKFHSVSCHGRRGVFPTAIVLPLLSSSCCAIQILVNAISGWGCAGFNTYLGPVRPYLLSVLLLSTWKLLPQRSIGWSALSLFLAFLPEVLHLWNASQTRGWKQQKSNVNKVNSSKGEADALGNSVTATLRLNIPTMGCVACVNKIDSSIRKCESAVSNTIIEEASWLNEGQEKGGRAELKISASNSDGVQKVVDEVVLAVGNAGFDCKVESLNIDEICNE